VAPRH